MIGSGSGSWTCIHGDTCVTNSLRIVRVRVRVRVQYEYLYSYNYSYNYNYLYIYNLIRTYQYKPGGGCNRPGQQKLPSYTPISIPTHLRMLSIDYGLCRHVKVRLISSASATASASASASA